MSFYLPASKQ